MYKSIPSILQTSFSNTIKANELWGKIVHNAWKSAELRILFWDTIKTNQFPIVMLIWF